MSDQIRPINEDYSSAGQLTPEQIQQVAAQGFRSILNLRSHNETGVLPNEAEQVNSTGLDYAQVPISPTDLEADSLDKALHTLNHLPKPVLIHCRSGNRATAVVLIAIAQQHTLSPEQFIQQVQAQGLTLEQPQIKQFWSDHYAQNTQYSMGWAM